MNEEIKETTQTLQPFTRLCMTIGQLPSSYVESMSYYEQLIWFTKFLQDQVIPAVNQNAAAVEELQGYYIELQDYVNHYFDNLDVQEEINNKLDKMATDGTLTSLIKGYIDPIYEAFETEINGKIDSIEDDLDQVQSAVVSLGSGSPLAASSTSEMTDTTRIYVNTTDGKWYYYDGDSWEIGGTYQSSVDSEVETNNSIKIEVLDKVNGTNLTNDFTWINGYQIPAKSDDQNYGNPVSSTNFKYNSYLDIGDYEYLDIVCVVRKYSATAITGLCFYDYDHNPIQGYYYTDADVDSGYTIHKYIQVPTLAKYIRTSLFSDSSSIGSNTVDFECYGFKHNTGSEFDNVDTKMYNIAKGSGYIDLSNIKFNYAGQIVGNTGICYPSSNYYATDFIRCDGFDYVKSVMVVRKAISGAYSGIAFYDNTKTYISGVYFTDDSVDTGYSRLEIIKIPTNATYFRTTKFSDESTHGTNTLTFTCELYAKNKVFNEVRNVGYSRFYVPNYPHHDSTIVGNEIWAFNKPSDGYSKIYDLEFNWIKNLNINFTETYVDSSTSSLQMKSVDFNNLNNVLLVGNGKSSYSPTDSYIYAFYDVLDWKTAEGEINFSTCGDYTKIDVTDLGVKPYAFWAGLVNDVNDQIYVSVNLFKDIYLIQLGKGETQLENGTYNYIDYDKYNGTYRILKHWEQECVMTSDYSAHGGQAYNGKLYLVNNDYTKNEIYECILSDDGKLKFNVIDAQHYLRDMTKEYNYLDGMFILDGYIYSAPLYINGAYHSGDNKVVLKIKI